MLVTLPLTNLKKGTEKLRKHFYFTRGNAPRKYHLQAVEKAEKLLSIDQQLSSIRAEIVSQNRKIMKCIAETVIGGESPLVSTEMIGSMWKMLQMKTLETLWPYFNFVYKVVIPF